MFKLLVYINKCTFSSLKRFFEGRKRKKSHFLPNGVFLSNYQSIIILFSAFGQSKSINKYRQVSQHWVWCLERGQWTITGLCLHAWHQRSKIVYELAQICEVETLIWSTKLISVRPEIVLTCNCTISVVLKKYSVVLSDFWMLHKFKKFSSI